MWVKDVRVVAWSLLAALAALGCGSSTRTPAAGGAGAGGDADAQGGTNESTAGSGGRSSGMGGSQASAGKAGASTDNMLEGELPPLSGPKGPHDPVLLISPKHVIGSQESVISSALDENDNLLVLGVTELQQQFIAKYDRSYQMIWRQELDRTFTVVTWAVTRAGEVFLGGDIPGPNGTGHAATVAKWDTGGKLAWQDVWTTGPSQITAIAEGPNGDIFATGSPGTLLPGHRSDEQDMYQYQAFIERLDATGTRKSVTQYMGITQGMYRTAIPNSLFVDAAGASFMGITVDTTGYLRSVAADGTFIADNLLTDTAHTLSILGGRTPFDAATAAWAPDRKAIYSLQEVSSEPPIGKNLQGVLAKVGLDGSLLWYRSAASKTGVLDTTVNGQWTGTFTNLSVVTTAGDALYVAGHYANAYSGDNPPAGVKTGFLARYDLDGNQVWFDEMLLDESMVNNTMKYAPTGIAAINLNAKGNPVLVFNGAVAAVAPGGGYTIVPGWYAVEFSAADGS